MSVFMPSSEIPYSLFMAGILKQRMWALCTVQPILIAVSQGFIAYGENKVKNSKMSRLTNSSWLRFYHTNSNLGE